MSFKLHCSHFPIVDCDHLFIWHVSHKSKIPVLSDHSKGYVLTMWFTIDVFRLLNLIEVVFDRPPHTKLVFFPFYALFCRWITDPKPYLSRDKLNSTWWKGKYLYIIIWNFLVRIVCTFTLIYTIIYLAIWYQDGLMSIQLSFGVTVQ